METSINLPPTAPAVSAAPGVTVRFRTERRKRFKAGAETGGPVTLSVNTTGHGPFSVSVCLQTGDEELLTLQVQMR